MDAETNLDIAPIERYLGTKLRGKPLFVYFFSEYNQESVIMRQIINDIEPGADLVIRKIDMNEGPSYKQREARNLLDRYGGKLPLILKFDAKGECVGKLNKANQQEIESLLTD
jgi:hypothetical protein